MVQVDGVSVATSLVNATQLSASIPSYSSTGTHAVTVVNPAPGGGTSSALTLTVVAMLNPVAVLSSLSPCGKVAGSGAFTLTLTGSSLVSGATATFNGAPVTVTYLSSTSLTAAIPAAAIASAPANNAAAVVVTNPGPGGGASAPVTFGVASSAQTLSGGVQALFTANCATAGCHVSVGTVAPMSLQSGSTYANTVGVTSTGCAPALRVKACGPLRSQSVLIDKVKATGASPPCAGSPMPKGAPLTASQIQTIVDWVAQGAPQ